MKLSARIATGSAPSTDLTGLLFLLRLDGSLDIQDKLEEVAHKKAINAERVTVGQMGQVSKVLLTNRNYIAAIQPYVIVVAPSRFFGAFPAAFTSSSCSACSFSTAS